MGVVGAREIQSGRKRRWLGAVAASAVGLAALGLWLTWPVDPALLAPPTRPAFVLQDRHGLELRATRASDGSLRRWVPLADVDPDLIAAFLAVEDRRFYEHGGVDLRAIGRAVRANLRAGRVVSGASTITMQLARILRPSRRTPAGKAAQVLWALRLERALDKQAILEQYLNRLPLGQGAVGIDAAAALYFGASAGEVSLGQAALLAGLARAPSSTNPLVSAARAGRRRKAALGQLVRSGYADSAAADRAALEPVLDRAGPRAFLAPHFTTRVASWIEAAGAPGVGTWRTSLDLGLQVRLETEVGHAVTMLRDRGVRHAAAVVLDNERGEVLAWVGSPDFWADTAGQVDMVVSRRQPGSTLKPFLYGLAFDRGYTPASILPDIARVYQTGSGPYSPRNYDRRFHGPVRAREALASSYNLPAVELADRLGAASLLHLLREGGFASLGRSAEFYGLGLALGNGDVTLLELANGYRALANGGIWRPYRWRATPPGDRPAPGRRILSERSAALVLDILADPVARIPGFDLETPLDFPFPAAAKTGTSRHFTDNWAVAVTRRFTVAVWAGNFSGRPMDGVSGISGAGPLLHRAVLATARRYDPGVLPSPESVGVVPVTICRLSGLRAGPACPRTEEWFAPGSEPEHDCDWHREGGVAVPAEYAEWAAAEQFRVGVAATSLRADAASGGAGPFRIVSPADGDRYHVPPGVPARFATVPLRAAGAGSAGKARWLVDGRLVSSGRWALVAGRHVVRAVAGDGGAAEVTIEVD
jgi:penicillin-binding protein 1C